MKRTILRTINSILNENGINCYFPSQHKGDCLEKYVVVKLGGGVNVLSVSSERPLYTFILHVPENSYSDLEPFMFHVKQILKTLYPLIEYAGNETPSYFDEDKKAHVLSFDYQGVRKIMYRK